MKARLNGTKTPGDCIINPRRVLTESSKLSNPTSRIHLNKDYEECEEEFHTNRQLVDASVRTQSVEPNKKEHEKHIK